MKICVVLGTRPELIKMQPILKEVIKCKHDLLFIHSGQHFDFMMSDIFINELKIKPPDCFLKVKTDSQGMQTGQIISSVESILIKEQPEIVLVQGDTNTALGTAIAAAKIDIPIGHVEAGCRSFDMHMSEEINRAIIADVASMNFAPTSNCVENLKREGISLNKIYMTGHPLVDLITGLNLADLRTLAVHNLNLNDSYYLLTIHRRENIENPLRINEMFRAIKEISETSQIVFPCHPHTLKQIKKYNLHGYLTNINIINTVGYFESLSLIKNAKIVMTDSGGIQQESAILGTPCLTLREVTEWIETIESGTNVLAGHSFDSIMEKLKYVEDNYDRIMNNIRRAKNLFGKIGSSERIVRIIENELRKI